MKEYIKKVSIPILWEVLFVVSCVFLPEQYAVYTNFLFYFGIIIFFILAHKKRKKLVRFS